MDAKVIWKHGLSFRGSADSGYEVPLGSDAEAGASDGGFRPMELLATGLAGCTAMDVISVLEKKRQQISGFEVTVHTEQAADFPRVFTRAVIDYYVTGKDVNETAVARSIELSATKYCPAQAMFSKLFPIELRYHIYEQEADGRHLVKDGLYIMAEVDLTGSVTGT
jgi:putative redox protein